MFFQLSHEFPHSHVTVVMPKQMAPGKELPPLPPGGAELLRGGPGFETVLLRRQSSFSFVVGDVIRDSPADRAGIEPGWMIMSYASPIVGDKLHFKGEFQRLTNEQARTFESRFRFDYPGVHTAEEGNAMLAATRVKLEYDFELLPVPPRFESYALGRGITYLRFDTFADEAIVTQALGVIDSAGPQGLILDMRRNTGGSTDALHRVLLRLLGQDAYIGTERSGWRFRNLRTARKGPVYSGPLAVLIGPASASAAEVLASAVQDNKRGPLIGRMSNGSVMTAQMFPLPDGGQAQIPVQDFVRGGGRLIEGVGVEPDIWLLSTLADVRAGRDPALERAIDELRRAAKTVSARR